MLIDFLSPARLLFGPGCSGRIGLEVERLGKKPLIITGQKSLALSGNLDRIYSPLVQIDIKPVFFAEVADEPTVDLIDRTREVFRDNQCDLIIGVGGGSVLDVAKAAAGLMHETLPTIDYFKGKSTTARRTPWMAVPTTAGSGSEVTDNAVLIDPASGVKASLRCETWMADSAIVDPIFTMSAPKKLTAATGLDAFSHALESLVSRWANPYTSALSQTAAVLIIQNLYTAYALNKKEAREKVMLASMMAGKAINLVHCGLTHALAHGLGGRHSIRHGSACAALLPMVMKYNLPVVENRYASIAYASNLAPVSCPETQAAERLIYFVEKFIEKMQLTGHLRDLGIKAEDLPQIAMNAAASNSADANPRRVQVEELIEMLQKSL